MFDQDFLRQAIIAAPAIIFALTVHEFFHAWTALKFGDPTARDLGRLTLNPLKHLDLLGTAMLFLSQFRFGWAKPVPVDLRYVRDPRKASLWISAAGPISNVGLAIIFAIIFRLIPDSMATNGGLVLFLWLSVSINVSLALFNMIPLFPLDGSHILRALLPPRAGDVLDRLDVMAPFILMGLILVGGTSLILGPPISLIISLLIGF